MNTGTKVEVSEVEVVGMGLDIQAILAAADRVEEARIRAKVAAEELRALLPYATPEEFAVLVNCARTETTTPEGFKVGEDFVLTDGQQMAIEGAKKERRAHLSREDVKRDLVGGILADRGQVLTSFKVRVGTKKTSTVARFEKGAAGVGLIAKLRAQARG